MATVFTSNKPCALCGSKELTFDAKTPNLSGIMCAKCLHQRAGEKKAKKPELK
jgi:hypothetical protein